MKATISADIIDSTMLTSVEIVELRKRLDALVDDLCTSRTCAWGRVVRGDGIELSIRDSRTVLRAALLVKSYIGWFLVRAKGGRLRKCAVRLAIGIGGLRIDDALGGILDGDAIYRSGRALDAIPKSARSTMVVNCGNGRVVAFMRPMLALLDFILNKATAKQCEALYFKLMGEQELAIATRMGISSRAVYAHLQKGGWFAIFQTLEMFEAMNFD